MTIPLILLAIPSALAGIVLGLPFADSPIKHWLEPVFHPAEETLGLTLPEFQLFGIGGALILVSTVVAAAGLAVGIWLFGAFRRRGSELEVERLTARVPTLYRASVNKWYFDDLNDLLFVRVGGVVANAFAWFDVHVIDGAVNGVARVVQGAGREIRQVQTGRVQNYALGIAAGLIVIAFGFIVAVTR
jgi:NADH:ubiquinone oxidoreductase subunit 5 (subunit L)/multisubunit Na+/H+ antiporter MnhA subunit